MKLLPNIRSIAWNLGFIAKPIACSAVAVAAWYGLRSRGVCLSKESETIMTCGVLVVIGIIYGIIASKALESAWEDQKRMAKAILEYDRHTYLVYRDEHVPVVIQLFLGALSTLLLASTMILHYEEESCGVIAVSCVAFVTSLLYFVVQKVDDPRGSPWFKKSTPKGWDDVDSRVYRRAMIDGKKAAEMEIDERIKALKTESASVQ